MNTDEACDCCYSSYRDQIETDSHHPADSSGSLCYNCHMPHTTYTLLKGIRSHQISGPNISTTLSTGRQMLAIFVILIGLWRGVRRSCRIGMAKNRFHSMRINRAFRRPFCGCCAAMPHRERSWPSREDGNRREMLPARTGCRHIWPVC